MHELGVSRPVVREALRVLENEQLLTVQRGALGGARVDRPKYAVVARYASLMLMMDGASIEDVFDARTLLELEAIRLLATAHDADVVEKLRGLIRDEEAAIGDSAAFAAAYDALNEAILDLCPNPAISMLWHTLDEIMTKHRQHFVAHKPADAMETASAGVRAHRRTLSAIAAGKPEEAERAWSRHREASSRLLLGDKSLAKVVDLLD